MQLLEPTPYPTFSISVVPQRSEVAVVAVGELDLATVPDVREAIGELRAAGFEEIALDLREVEFIDCAGVRMLLGLREDADRDGHVLRLLPPPAPARRVFDLTRTRWLFD